MKQLPASFLSNVRNYKLWQLALVAYWLAIFVGTHVPGDFLPEPSDGWDKVVHFSAYAALAVLVATTWQLAAGQLMFRHLRAAWIVIAIYGALDEWTQSFVGRDASVYDWLFDIAGAATGLALFVWLRERIGARRRAGEG